MGGVEARRVCEHAWISMHEPDHILYWVRVCCLCSEPDWDVLDSEIKKLLDRREMEFTGYQSTAVKAVFKYVSDHLEKTDTHVTFKESDVYVVWFSKTLKNWKALVSTALPDGMYYELTFNGETNELYLDAYKKFDNVAIQVDV